LEAITFLLESIFHHIANFNNLDNDKITLKIRECIFLMIRKFSQSNEKI